MRPRRKEEERWVYLHLEDILKSECMQIIVAYIGRIQNTVAYWVVTRLVLDLCQKSEDPTGRGQPRRRWWDQVVPLEWEEEERRVGRVGQGNGYERR